MLVSCPRNSMRFVAIKMDRALHRSASAKMANSVDNRIGSDNRQLFFDGLRCQVRNRNRTIRFDPAGLRTRPVAVRIDFGPENGNFFRRLNTDLNGISVDPSHFDMDQVADDDPLVDLSR